MSKTAYTYAKYKLKKETGKIDDIGLMSIKEFREKILTKKFIERETRIAVEYLSIDRLLDKYYIDICEHCSFENIMKEELPKNNKTEKQITNGYKCKSCRKEAYPDKPLDVKYAVSHELLDKEKSETETLFHSIKRWLPWTNSTKKG